MIKREVRLIMGKYIAVAVFLLLSFSYVYYERGVSDTILIGLLWLLFLGCYGIFRLLLRKRVIPENATFSFKASPAALALFCVSLVSVTILVLLATSYRLPDVSFAIIILPVLKNVGLIAGPLGAATMLWYVSGSAISRLLKLDFSSGLERTVYSIALGSFVMILFFYGAALLHALVPASLAAYAGIVVILCRREMREALSLIRQKSMTFAVSFAAPGHETSRTAYIVLATSFLVLVFVSVGGYFPIGGDDIRTYYNVPKTYLENNGIVNFPYDSLNNGSLAFAYLYVPFMLIDHRLTNFVSALFFVLVLLSVFAISKRFFGERVALASSFFFFTIPWSLWFLVTAKVDFMVTYYITIGLGALAIYAYREGKNRWLTVTGLCIGCAVAIKYSALLFAPAVAAFLLGGFFAQRLSFFKTIRAGMIIAAVAFVAFAPWAIRNYYYWENPVYPFTLSGKNAWLSAQSEPAQEFYRQFYSSAIDVGHVLNKSNPWWKNLWYLITAKSDYTANKIGPLFFGILPFLVLLRPKREDTGILISSILALCATFVAWFLVVTIEVWYMMFIFPLWCIVAAYYFTRIPQRFIRAVIVSLVMIAFVLELNMTRVFIVRFYSDRLTIRNYLEPFAFGVTLSDYLNERVLPENPNYLSLPVGQQRQILVKDNYRHIYGDNIFLSSLVAWAAETTGPEELRDRMRSEGITHIHYLPDDVEIWRGLWCDRAHDDAGCARFRFVMGRFDEMARTLSVVTTTPEWTLYEL